MPRYGGSCSVSRMFSSSNSLLISHHMDVSSPINKSRFANTVSPGSPSLARMTSVLMSPVMLRVLTVNCLLPLRFTLFHVRGASSHSPSMRSFSSLSSLRVVNLGSKSLQFLRGEAIPDTTGKASADGQCKASKVISSPKVPSVLIFCSQNSHSTKNILRDCH